MGKLKSGKSWETPVVSVVRLKRLRPLTAIWVTCVPEIKSLTSPDSLCTFTASSTTVRVSVISPSCIWMSTRTTSFTFKTIPVRS